MAKDSFFIRSTKDLGNTNAYHEKEIDLGAFIDVAGGTILRLHSMQVVWSDSAGTSTVVADETVGAAQFQLLTQSQNSIVLASDKAVIASGRILAQAGVGYAAPLGAHYPGNVTDTVDLSPSFWSNGYLIATESLYLGGSASTEFPGDQYVTVILECTTEKMTKSNAMALSLSQQ